VAETGFCTIAELSVALGVSEMTVRRDTQLLVREGRIRSVHGGVTAVPRKRAGGRSTPVPEPVRTAIARRIVQLLPERGAIALDSGTVPQAVAAELPAASSLQVVSASLGVLNALSERDDLDVIALGGMFNQSSQSYFGPATLAAVSELRVRVFVLTGSSATAKGIYCASHSDAMTKRALIAIADTVVLAGESTMFDMSATVRACALDEVDVVVTDDRLRPSDRAVLESHGTSVVLVAAAGATGHRPSSARPNGRSAFHPVVEN
jgi:DeoR/GlpR family transcriptional regulator of sugar metabolism